MSNHLPAQMVPNSLLTHGSLVRLRKCAALAKDSFCLSKFDLNSKFLLCFPSNFSELSSDPKHKFVFEIRGVELLPLKPSLRPNPDFEWHKHAEGISILSTVMFPKASKTKTFWVL